MGSKPIGISASRGAAILGMSKYSDPVEAWLKICEDITPGFCEANLYPVPEMVDSAATRWGNALEDKICEFAERNTDGACHIFNREKLSQHEKHSFITCHQDGTYALLQPYEESSSVIHEGKTTNERTFRSEWGAPGTDQIPRAYMVQVQHQMALTGAERCIVSVLVLPKIQGEMPQIGDSPWDDFAPDGEWNPIPQAQIDLIADGLYSMGYFHQYPVERNQNLIDLMITEYVKFWNENVLKKIPPKPQSFEWVKKLIPTPCGTVIANEQVERWSNELKGWQREKKGAESQIKQLKTWILDYMREESASENVVIDNDSKKRVQLMAPNGFRLHSYNGKQFR